MAGKNSGDGWGPDYDYEEPHPLTVVGKSIAAILAWPFVQIGRLGRFLMTSQPDLWKSAQRDDGSFAQLGDVPPLGPSERARIKGVKRYRHGGASAA